MFPSFPYFSAWATLFVLAVVSTAVYAKRRRDTVVSRSQLFEKLLWELSAELTHSRNGDVHQTVDRWLERISSWLGYETGLFFLLPQDGIPAGSGAHGSLTLKENLFLECLKSIEALRCGEVVRQERPDNASKVAVHSLCAVPVQIDGLTYVLAFGNARSPRRQQENMVSRLTVVGQVFAGTLARQRHEDFLRKVALGLATGPKQTFFDSLVTHLSYVLQTDAALIVEFTSAKPDHVRTLSAFADGRILENFEYDLPLPPESTPIFSMPHRTSVFMRNPSGVTIGIVVVHSRKPLSNHRTVEAMLQIVAVRAAGEILRNEAEGALREMDSKNRAILRALPDLMFLMDEAGTYLECYPDDPRKFFRPPELFLGRNIREIMPAELCDRVAHKFIEASTTGHPAILEYSLPIDGEMCYYEARIVKRSDGHFLSIVRDITANRRAEIELERLSSRLFSLQDEESRKIARELHDVTAQNLFAISLQLEPLRQKLVDSQSDAARTLAECQFLCDRSLREIRKVSYHFHPPALDKVGFSGAVHWYTDGIAERTGVRIKLDIDSEVGRLPLDIETDLFRIVQCALTNIVKYSDGEALVRLRRCASRVVLQITDHGKVLPLPLMTSDTALWLGVGLPWMKERLRELGGVLEVHLTDQGTLIEVQIPLASMSEQNAARG